MGKHPHSAAMSLAIVFLNGMNLIIAEYLPSEAPDCDIFCGHFFGKHVNPISITTNIPVCAETG
jgi:hypothetical protein